MYSMLLRHFILKKTLVDQFLKNRSVLFKLIDYYKQSVY